jgi:hypothetical protein
MRFEFDPAKAQSNLRKHGVGFAHAEQVLLDAFAITMEDPDAVGEQRFLTLGRILVVCHTPREGRTRIIPARKASKNEVKNYHA